MEYVVYIPYSQKHQKSYTGISSDLISRFHSHNKYAIKGWTISYRPWIVIHIEFFESKKEALSREKWFKSGIGRKEKKEIINQFFNIV
ncbi:GIY-YIG nuclease family protein [uncultured Dokdonia sp.]|uniref:GIY-YIG nuclease family protein n=1 Tax=uncultured Dokdonia sp. TaxID=575653 RepID=UPI00262F5ABF|nr:GIY-YIG nuclease family protein [uncultured Dokdonia sp.]